MEWFIKVPVDTFEVFSQMKKSLRSFQSPRYESQAAQISSSVVHFGAMLWPKTKIVHHPKCNLESSSRVNYVVQTSADCFDVSKFHRNWMSPSSFVFFSSWQIRETDKRCSLGASSLLSIFLWKGVWCDSSGVGTWNFTGSCCSNKS